MRARLAFVLGLLLSASALDAQLLCSGGACPGGAGFSSPVTTDPVSATGAWTFNNVANTAVTLSDGASGPTLVGTTSSCGGGAVDAATSVCLSANTTTYEGATANTFETLIVGGDATADNTLTLTATATGITAAVTTGSLESSSPIAFPAAAAANSVELGETAGCVTLEGSTANAFEARLCATDPSGGDSTFNLPNLGAAASYTLAHIGPSIQAFAGPLTMQNHTMIENSIVLQIGGTLVSAAYGGLSLRTENTPDTDMMYTGFTSNHWIFGEFGDLTFDFAHAVATNPTLFIHSANQSTTQWLGLTHNATDAVVSSGTGNIMLDAASGATWGVKSKTLTETSATAFVQVDVAASTSVGGTVTYSIEADDATEFQARSGVLPFAAVNKAGVETCTVGTVGAATEVVAVSSGTLTNTFTCATTPANGITLLADATSSLTQTTLRISYSVRLSGFATSTVTPQ